MATERVERRLAAILAADVAGYSRLIGADEEGTLARLRALRRDLTDATIAGHRGRIVKTTGDGVLVEFASVLDALRCATEIQTALAERNAVLPADHRIEFRIGIHQGDVVVEDGDIFGDGVNVAARLEALAEPGGICVSVRVQEDAAGRLDLAFEDLGEQRLKNIARPVRVYRVRVALTHSGPAEQGRGEAGEGGAPALALPGKPSIAVLPFANMSGDPEQEYFADGMVEEIITALSRIRWLFVIARNSSFTYKGQAIDVKQVGRELGVRYVLEGSVRKSGNRVRITAQLIGAMVGNQVWAQRYDRELADIFAVQDEITERVVAAIEPQLYAAEHYRNQRKPPESLDAWECLARALSYVGQGTFAGYQEGEALCRRAIAIDPGYSQAHSLLAWVLLRRTIWSGDLKSILPEATAETRTAIGLDEHDPWSHMAQGAVLHRMRRFEEAVLALHQALELNPNFALAHAYLAAALAIQGAHEEAVKSAEHALRLSPNDRLIGGFALNAVAVSHFAARRYADCVASARKAIERNRDYPVIYAFLAAAAAFEGNMSAAEEALTNLLRLQPHFSLTSVRENGALVGEMAERALEGLRRAGAPEE